MAVNGRQLFKSKFMQALILWRKGEDPRSTLESCVNRLFECADDLFQFNPDAKVGVDLPLEKAMLLTFLTERHLDIPWGFSEIDVPDRRLDYLLATALRSGFALEVPVALDILAEKKECDLSVRSYRTYFEILDHSVVNVPIEKLVQVAEEQFRGRAKDNFFSGGDQTEGGGSDNDLVVDYRLAAVLKAVGYAGVSVHKTIW